VLAVGKTHKEILHGSEKRLYPSPNSQKHHIFGASFIKITRKRTHKPKRKKHQLQKRKDDICDAVGEKGNQTENKRNEHYKQIQMIVSVPPH
jgi:hypothetical protein